MEKKAEETKNVRDVKNSKGERVGRQTEKETTRQSKEVGVGKRD